MWSVHLYFVRVNIYQILSTDGPNVQYSHMYVVNTALAKFQQTGNGDRIASAVAVVFCPLWAVFRFHRHQLALSCATSFELNVVSMPFVCLH